MIVGHTHRVSNLQYGDILITEGINAGASYSVLQLMIKGGDVAWAGGATRVAKTIGMTARPDVQAIIDAANAETAELRNQVIGTQTADILRDPTRRTSRRWATSSPTRCGTSTQVSTVRSPTPVVLRADLVCSPAECWRGRV